MQSFWVAMFICNAYSCYFVWSRHRHDNLSLLQDVHIAAAVTGKQVVDLLPTRCHCLYTLHCFHNWLTPNTLQQKTPTCTRLSMIKSGFVFCSYILRISGGLILNGFYNWINVYAFYQQNVQKTDLETPKCLYKINPPLVMENISAELFSKNHPLPPV